ncbi:Cytochrome P450 [Amycolatopsis tolypomycina]|uniref:Cytochrome P450 n=1 Tax=Amycolatopsis tolypomycina TaxID=208445 RepID=A0A1H4TZB1_9PSEU|nr:cytochrome P450 [Amycolatopsis tolypomycina]SEC61344.1 Cytochrome P450 [Amycolatopsis tolypomycina]
MVESVEIKADLSDPEFLQNPYPALAALRRDSPVARVKTAFGFDAWLLTGYDLVRESLADPRLVRNVPGEVDPIRQGTPGGVAGRDFVPPSVLDTVDPPEHTRLRALVQPAFTSHRIDGLAGRIEAVVAPLVEELGGTPEWDVVPRIAYRLPLAVIGDILGTPRGDDVELVRITAGLLAEDTDGDRFRAHRIALHSLRDYLVDLIAQQRRRPGEDLTSKLVEAVPATDEVAGYELVSLLVNIVVAGYLTTGNVIGSGLAALLTHPGQLALLRGNRGYIPSAVEEFGRIEAPFTSVLAFAAEDLAYGEAAIERGDAVISSLTAANRDPARFADPDRFDITRPDHGQLAYSRGIHRCLGSHLARVEVAVFLRLLLDRFPVLELACAPEDLRWRAIGEIRGLRAVPVRTA